MADSMYRNALLYCYRCGYNLYAEEHVHEDMTPGVPVRVAVVRCANPRCEHVVTHAWPGAVMYLTDAEMDALRTLLERGEARKQQAL